MSLDRVVSLYHSLIEYMKTVRQSFDTYEVVAKQLTTNNEYASDTKRRRKSKQFFDDHGNGSRGGEKDAAEQLSGKQKFVVQTFYVIVDQLIVELEKRQKAYVDISSRFGFLISDPNTAMPVDEVRKSANALQQEYADDLEENFCEEFIQFKNLNMPTGNPITMRQYIMDNDLTATFPNVETALRMFLTLPVANVSGERSFSYLKRIKNAQRTTMSDDRLSAFGLLAIESEFVRKIDFDDVIDAFAVKNQEK